MKKIIVFIFLPFVFFGCARLAHLPQLLTLKKYSENGDQQQLYVQQQDKKFEKLLMTVKTNQLGRYQDKESVLKEFGEPVVILSLAAEDGQMGEEWVYRYSVVFFGSEKVYLYFDEAGLLKNWEHIPPRKKKDDLS